MSIDKRTYLVGCALQGLLACGNKVDVAAAVAIRAADLVMEKMQWPNGKPDMSFVRMMDSEENRVPVDFDHIEGPMEVTADQKEMEAAFKKASLAEVKI